MTYTFVLNVTCDRILFFTDDPTYVPPASPYTWIAYYDGELPLEMNHGNCWSWRYRNDKLYLASSPETFTPGSLKIQRLKDQLKDVLGDLCDEMIRPLQPRSKVEQTIAEEATQQAKIFIENGTIGSILQDLSISLGVTVQKCVEDILEKRNTFVCASLNIELLRRAFISKIDALTDFQEGEKIRRQIASRRDDFSDLNTKRQIFENETFFFDSIVMSPNDGATIMKLRKLSREESTSETITARRFSDNAVDQFTIDQDLAKRIIAWLDRKTASVALQYTDQVSNIRSGEYSRSFKFTDPS